MTKPIKEVCERFPGWDASPTMIGFARATGAALMASGKANGMWYRRWRALQGAPATGAEGVEAVELRAALQALADVAQWESTNPKMDAAVRYARDVLASSTKPHDVKPGSDEWLKSSVHFHPGDIA